MPAPKMKLNGIDINQPKYGYSTEIYTGLKWEFVGDNYQAYDQDVLFCRTKLNDLLLDETQQAALDIVHDSNVDLILNTSASTGFYPFSPLYNSGVYNLRVVDHEYTGLIKSPWKYTSNTLDLIYQPPKPEGIIDFSTTNNEGNVFLFGGGLLLDKIREIDQAPGLSIPKNYNVALSQIGTSYHIGSNNNKYAGFTSEVELQGSLLKTYQILRFLYENKGNTFFIGDNLELTYTQLIETTKQPDYYLFGKKISMSKYHTGGQYLYGWQVKNISNPIIVTHNYLNNFSIKLTLALVV